MVFSRCISSETYSFGNLGRAARQGLATTPQRFPCRCRRSIFEKNIAAYPAHIEVASATAHAEQVILYEIDEGARPIHQPHADFPAEACRDQRGRTRTCFLISDLPQQQRLADRSRMPLRDHLPQTLGQIDSGERQLDQRGYQPSPVHELRERHGGVVAA